MALYYLDNDTKNIKSPNGYGMPLMSRRDRSKNIEEPIVTERIEI